MFLILKFTQGSVTPLLEHPIMAPISFRIKSKVLTMVYKALHDVIPIILISSSSIFLLSHSTLAKQNPLAFLNIPKLCTNFSFYLNRSSHLFLCTLFLHLLVCSNVTLSEKPWNSHPISITLYSLPCLIFLHSSHHYLEYKIFLICVFLIVI